MHFEPEDLFQKLEFDKVLELLGKECLGELGQAAVQKIIPGTAQVLIERKLNEVAEFKNSIENDDWFPISTYSDISADLKTMAIEGYVLPENSIKNIGRILKLIKNIFKFFNKSRQDTYPHLHDIIKDVPFDPELIKAIDKVLDDDGNIKPDASPELQRIRKLTVSKQKELDKQFRVIVNSYKNKGWLTDNVESFRNGRRVLSVPAEHKRKIRGIIHDESTTGKTAFIEPEAIIDINNDIFDLETEEKKEIYRLLKELSATLRPHGESIKTYQKILVKLDIIQAKVRLGQKMKATKPIIKSQPFFQIIEGYHPLLLLKNEVQKKKTISFSLRLNGHNRILMLSGPNAGGKSITMKSVGLMQLMVQSGMLIPVDPKTEMGIFHKIFADIGDQQSIEDDLSTYSSRLKNMKNFLKYANQHTLVLIDEFGSGTDPKIGGAIAEAILKDLNYKKIFGVITTHYSNLKIYAFKNPGIVNGSMAFDKDTLSPTYELKVGRPGSSYAFEIAQKSGLHKRVLNYAQNKIGKNEKAVDELLVELQSDKQELEEKLAEVNEREKRLSLLIKNYEKLFKELEFQRKKFKLESKEQALQRKTQENKKLEKVIRELKEQQNIEKAKSISLDIKYKRKQLSEEVQDIKEDLYYKTDKKKEEAPIEVGSYVRLKAGGSTGQVESIDKNRAIVQIGALKITVNLRDLEVTKAPLEIQKDNSISTDMLVRQANFDPKIDIRGLRLEEAIRMIEEFVDKALMYNTPSIEIIHGRGTGVLRKAVRQKLKEYNTEMAVSYGDPEGGGDGVTLVEFS